MDRSQELLKQYVASKSKYFTLPEGEEVKVKFLHAEGAPNNFDGGKTNLIRYHLEIDGIKQLWDRPSRQLAQEMAKISQGDVILIKRTGQKSKTKYCITKVKE